VWHSLARDRRCPRDGCPASSAPARDTWPRTYPRRPGRGAADCLFAAAALRRGSWPGRMRKIGTVRDCPYLRGLESALQFFRRRTVLPGKRHVVVLEQAVVGQAADGREVAVRNVARALEAPDVVRHRAERQVNRHAVPR